jgi:hypothetical protein
MTDIDKLIAPVERMFDNHSFKKVTNANWLYGAVIDGVKVGVVEATYNQTSATSPSTAMSSGA